jgi:alpha,alpha-trehalase
MEKYLWNDKTGWYADYDLKSHKVRNQLTAAALFPLYVNAASRERAAKVASAAQSQLLKPGGLTTTTVNSGQQWDAPNGWAPLQWVAAQGLQNYGQQKMAMEVSWRFLSNVQHTYDSQQKLVEKYDVSSTGTGGGGGEYPLQDGFGWTNGVTLKMLDLVCPQEKPCDSLPASRPLDKVEKPVATVSTQPAANDAVAGADKKRRRNSPAAGPPPRLFLPPGPNRVSLLFSGRPR